MKHHDQSITYGIEKELTPFDYFSGVLGVLIFVLLVIFAFTGY